MWDPYIASIKANTDAQIIFDKFHIAKKINEALDDVRKNEFAKADTEERKRMKKKRFLLLSRQKRLNDEKRESLCDLKEIYYNFWNQALHSAKKLEERIKYLVLQGFQMKPDKRINDPLVYLHRFMSHYKSLCTGYEILSERGPFLIEYLSSLNVMDRDEAIKLMSSKILTYILHGTKYQYDKGEANKILINLKRMIEE